MEEKDLDFVLVPVGLLVMAVYHVWLLYRIRRKPVRTVVGMNAINRRFWVSSMMEVCYCLLYTRTEPGVKRSTDCLVHKNLLDLYI
ncbi:hypothetical protein HanPI659440_Chr05g0211141 [Helianthus annuus]|nr:hypothetical protein HanPI659440_Chr05g0211141 [Helianthus annuus]